MKIYRIDTPLRLTLAYAAFGAGWIVGSDRLAAWLTGEPTEFWRMGTAKGLLFIAVTSFLLYLLSKRLTDRHLATEQRLLESKTRWQFALESTGTGIWEWNEETREAYYSPQWKSILGYADHEIESRYEEWLDRVHPDERPLVEREMQRHATGETPTYECEFRMRAKDGGYRWILARGRVMTRRADGRPLRAFGTHTDITDRKSNESRTTNALAFARAVLRFSPMAIVVYGPDGRCAIANESAARVIGTDVPGVLRQNFRQLDSWRQSGLLAMAERVLATGNEDVFRGKVTTSFGQAIWIEARLVAFNYEGGQHLLVLLSDQTDQRHTLANLHLMHAAVQAAPIGWVVTDAEGVVQWVNPGFTRLTGYTAEEAVGRNPRVLKSGRHSPEFYAGLWQTIKRGEVWSGEMFNQRKDGTQYNEQMTIVPVRGADETITHYVAIKQDITERKSLEQQVARTQRLDSVGLLASGIAHDLNNIFAPILLSLELLKLKYPDAEARHLLELIENSGQRGAGIVRQVLTFARGMDGERTTVQPKYLVKELAQMLGETLPRNITIETQLAVSPLAVEADATQLHQVLLNLAVNARDAMPGGGHLALGVANVVVDEARAARNPPLKPGPCVALTVSDTGSGITPEVLEHMFEPFYTTKPRGKGTGLGLSTVYGIVRSHGGAVEVSSELGRGTCFTVLLPAVGEPAAGVAPRPPVAAALTGAGRRVLVVDDEESIRVISARALERHGFVVETAVDGVDALEKFGADPSRFAAVLADLMMPRMGGRDLVQEIRRLVPGLPIICSSGLMEAVSDQTGAGGPGEDGPEVLLRKPYGEKELVDVLGAELAIAAARAEKKG